MRAALALGSLAAVAATAAAAPAPQAATDSQYGSWALDYTWSSAANGWKTEIFAATYSLDNSTAKQTWTLLPPTDESTISDPASFTASWDGSVVSLSQTVLIDGTNTTIYGSAPLSRTCGQGGNGRTCTGSTTVEVTQAIA
ncbi:uncharacterized protein LTHEOB_782 [Neofusicoccum parvum]|uniref:Uncharacterized protein LTHEOB_782 n=1 Tax=Neofusicoccum parvum TaxID=310453 RepID=A0ACB5S7D2_9PEZI|nr:uncharacterized protein LTHEOB_782 [Neofusicoccum parvum]